MKSKIFILLVVMSFIVTNCTQSKRTEISETPIPKGFEVGPVLTGTDTGGGGSIEDIQKTLIEHKKEYLMSEIKRIFVDEPSFLKKTLIGFARNVEYYELPDATKKTILQMLDNGLVEDIKNTDFFIAKCIDKDGIKRSATAPMNEKGGTICLDPEDIVNSLGAYIPDSSIISLMMHEFSHHFGYEDKDYSLAKDVLIAIEKEMDLSFGNGENPNNLIRPDIYVNSKQSNKD